MGPIEKHKTSKMLFECQKSNTWNNQDKTAKRNRKERARNANMFIATQSTSWARPTAPRASPGINWQIVLALSDAGVISRNRNMDKKMDFGS